MKRPSLKSDARHRHRSFEERADLAFAQKRGLCYGSLLRWRSRQHPGGKVLVRPGAGSDPGFVPVKIESEVLSGDYVLSLAGGCSLKIPWQFDAQSLRRLLAVLGEAR